MVNPPGGKGGWLQIELITALALCSLALLPLAGAYLQDQRMCAAAYVHAVALQIVDGEMEALAAGAWHRFEDGTHPFEPEMESAQHLPPGTFRLTVSGDRLRLEWQPENRRTGPPVVRERIGQ